MNKIEIGMLVRIISVKRPENRSAIGEIHTVEALVDLHGAPGAHLVGWNNISPSFGRRGFALTNLEPILPDSEPADEDFQEDLKRFLDKKVTA